MKVAVSSWVALVLLLAASASVAGTLVENATLDQDGVTRYFDYYIPDSPESPAAPLYFLLHGGGGNKSRAASGAFAEMFRLADQHGFLLVIPNGVDPETGLSGIDGDYHWNDCRNDAGVSATFADDVGFIESLIDWMRGKQPIDEQRIYSVGASNGGMMSYRLALELSHRIAGIASVIANLPANSECRSSPAHPLTVLIMNGSAEDLWMPYAGGQVLNDRGLVLSAEATRDFFVGFIGASLTPEIFSHPDLAADDGGTVQRETHSDGAEGNQIIFHRVGGGGHAIPSIAHPMPALAELLLGKQNRDIEAAGEVWKHLEPVRLAEAEADAARELAVLLMLAFVAASRGRSSSGLKRGHDEGSTDRR